VTAGETLSSSDDKWLRKIGAEQQLFDGLTVSGSIGETAQGATSKSISAGLKRSWQMHKNRAVARHGNGRALPYLGRDAVKFSRSS